MGTLACSPDTHLRRDDERGDTLRGDILANFSCLDANRQSFRIALAPSCIELIDALAEAFIERRHFLGKIVQRTSLQESTTGDVFFHESAKRSFEVADRIRSADRLQP